MSVSRKLRGVLSRLDSRQQALIFGHAVPMPVLARTRDYGTAESYSAFTPSKDALDKGLENLFGPT